MSGQLPAPLVPADVDLRDFPQVMVNARKWRDTYYFKSGTAFVGAFTLMANSWHQVPAGSVPNDDRALSVLSGLGRKWRHRRADILQYWVLCSDGRYYFPDLVPFAISGWKKKQATARKISRRLEIESGEWAALRSAVFARDDYTCQYCGRRGVALECDHLLPVALGGGTFMENLRTACKACNRKKGSKHPAEWLP